MQQRTLCQHLQPNCFNVMTSAPTPTHVVPPSEPPPHDAQVSTSTAFSPPLMAHTVIPSDLVTVQNPTSTEPIANPQSSGAVLPNETLLKADMNVEDDDSVVQEEAAIEGLDATTEAKQKDWESKMEKRVSAISRNELPPSPPLTRDHSRESTRQPHPQISSEEKAKEIEGADWDPLRYGRTNYKEENQTQDVAMVVVEEGDVVDSHGRLLFPESEGKPSPSVSRRGSDLHLEFKPPSSPQPWDLIEPPTTNGNRTTDIYSTLESRKFNTLRSNPCVFFPSPRQCGFTHRASFSFGSITPQPYPPSNTQIILLFWTATFGCRIWHTSDRPNRCSPSSRNTTC